MKILMWVGIIFLALPIAAALIFTAFSFYANSPSTHNATAYDSKISNQYV